MGVDLGGRIGSSEARAALTGRSEPVVANDCAPWCYEPVRGYALALVTST